MTYCVGIKTDAGLAFASDSRTNAGVDQISTFGKMRVFSRPGDRWLVSVCSGHLGITQGAANRIERWGRGEGERSWRSVETLREAAALWGAALREEVAEHAHLRLAGVSTDASFIVGGQIGAEAPGMFLIYPEGNFIEARDGTSFFQIGETKYGKPILDRMIEPGMSLATAAKCLMVSFDSTMRSNLSVGYPVDLALYEAGSLSDAKTWRFSAADPYTQEMREQWGRGLREVFERVPAPPGA